MDYSSSFFILRARNQKGHPHSTDRSSSQEINRLNWGQLENGSVSASLGILSRISAASLDPLTIAISRIVCGKFELSDQGKERVLKALTKLYCLPGFQELLWFGFGYKHVVHVLSDTSQGLACVGLAACLTEVHSEDYAAHVFDAIASSLCKDADEPLKPSLGQWKQLVKNCQGVLARLDFAVLAEELMGLADDALEPRVGEQSPSVIAKFNSQCRQSSSVNHLAGALIVLARISSGELHSFTISGGAECGFVVALAEWLLGLSTKILGLSSEANIICLRGSDKDSDVQLTWLLGSQDKSQHMEVSEQTYVISNGLDIFDSIPPEQAYLSGRVKWENAIIHSFGQAGRKLLSTPAIIGTAIGAAARLGSAAVMGEMITDQAPINESSFWVKQLRNDSCHGIGFTNLVVTYMPELATMQATMEGPLSYSYLEALRCYQKAMDTLALVCGCPVCCQEALDQQGVSLYTLAPEPFCLVVLLMVIIRLFHVLSCIDPRQESEEIMPSRLGIELFYLEFRKYGRQLYHTIDRLYEDPPQGTSMLSQAALIFAGRRNYIDDKRKLTAVSIAGICFYSHLLEGITDDPELVSIVTILPGQIFRGIRHYDLVSDYKSFWSSYPASRESVLCNVPSETDTSSPDLSASMVLSESMDGLSLSYMISCLSGITWIGPADLKAKVLLTTRGPQCQRFIRNGCSSLDKSFEGNTKDGYWLIEGEGHIERRSTQRLVVRMLKENTIARCVAVTDNEKTGLQILKRDQCLSCCVRYLNQVGWQDGIHDVAEIIC